MAFGRLLGAVACAGLIVACGEQVPNQPASGQNDVCSSDFDTCVMPILSSQIRREGGTFVGCMDSNCHAQGGSGGRFTLGSDNTANLQAAVNLINLGNSSDSLLLLEPTNDAAAPSAVAGTHGGGNIFRSTADECYVAIRMWIGNEYSCGACTLTADASVPGPTTTCGYP